MAQVYGALADLPIEWSDLTLDQALGPVLDLARVRGLSAYDAAYLELRCEKGCRWRPRTTPFATPQSELACLSRSDSFGAGVV